MDPSATPASTTQVLETIGYYALAFLVASIIGVLIVTPIVLLLVWIYFRDEFKDWRRGQLSAIIGILERILYMTAILIGHPELIGAWLVLKAVGEWGDTRKAVDDQQEGATRPGVANEYLLNLSGSLISLFVGVAFGYIIQALLPAIPPITRLSLPPG
jgi:hypothetical protein